MPSQPTTFNQSTIGAILDSEREMVSTGAERFGAYFQNAAELSDLLSNGVASMHADHFMLPLFLSHVRKHHTLALFSVARLHHVQAMMNLRQVLEAGACAAYAVVHADPREFSDIDEDGILSSSKKLAKKRYAWLEQNFPEGSAAMKNLKDSINSSAAHANVADTHQTFQLNDTAKKFETPFFDLEDDYFVKSDLWLVANIAFGLMDLLYGVNRKVEVVEFVPDFVPRLRTLKAENDRLKAEMMATDRYQAVERRRRGESA